MTSELRRLSQFEEEDWDSLLESIQKGDVVPVCGPELLVATEGTRTIPFYLKVVSELAKPFGISYAEGETLVDFATRVKGINPLYEQNKLQTRIRTVLGNLSSTRQPLLEKLISIDAFKLFLTTTPDKLLVNTIRNAGFETEEYQFWGHYKDDTDIPKESELAPEKRYVYHLFGKVDSGTDFAITEDDRLKYSCLWMELAKRPQQLLHYLEGKRLLVLGCGYENWQSRFFLYGLKKERLFSNSYMNSLFADSHAPADSKMDSFLSRSKGNIYYGGNASTFIDELCRRFQNYRQETKPPAILATSEQDEFKPNSIFISYASEDKEVAFAIMQRLDEAGWPVWLDKVKIPWGADWADEIKQNIHRCSHFIPLLSHHSTRINPCSPGRWFIREWNYAREERISRPDNNHFILPVNIDNCDPYGPGGWIPPEWRDLHIIEAPGGHLHDRDVEDIQKMMAAITQKQV